MKEGPWPRLADMWLHRWLQQIIYTIHIVFRNDDWFDFETIRWQQIVA
jgi:hypothetical protein